MSKLRMRARVWMSSSPPGPNRFDLRPSPFIPSKG
ncbi:uncharacterized protein LOC108149679 [Drosophila elegans]|nr:uncharacterized protein LOC108149679 [Drosophila elegans]